MKTKTLNKIFTLVSAAVVFSAACAVFLSAQQPQIRTPRQVPFPVNPDFSKLEVQTLLVQKNVYMIAGAGGNIAVQVGEEGVLMVDTGYEKMADKVLVALKKLSTYPIRYIINTTLSHDHTGGNTIFDKPGALGTAVRGRPADSTVVGAGDLLRLMTESEFTADKYPQESWPTKTYLVKSKDFFFNDEPIVMIHVPEVNTAGDSIVWLRYSDVIVTGEIFNQTSYPYIDLEHGGGINGIVEGLNEVLEMTVPKHHQEGGTMVIPGHGRISDEHDVLEYRDMITIIRNRVQNAINKKMTLAQVKAAKPTYTYEYDLRFGKNPAWTPEQFVEAIYKSLSK